MFDDRSRKYRNQYVSLQPVDISQYQSFIKKELQDEVWDLSRSLQNKIWTNVNSTFIGGGVARDAAKRFII